MIIVVAKVMVANATGGWDTLTPQQFMAKPVTERTMLILKRRVEFHDPAGKVIPPLDACSVLVQPVS